MRAIGILRVVVSGPVCISVVGDYVFDYLFDFGDVVSGYLVYSLVWGHWYGCCCGCVWIWGRFWVALV